MDTRLFAWAVMIEIWTVEDAGVNALETEARRIVGGYSDADRPLTVTGIDEFDVMCPGTASDILCKARTVMSIVNQISQTGAWPSESEWPGRLPSWFVDACRPEDAADENEPAEVWYALSQAERRARHLAKKWKLTWWTSWMEPVERQWMWWRVDVRDASTIHVAVDRLGDPPLGDPPGLWWLFSAAGAVSINQVLGDDV